MWKVIAIALVASAAPVLRVPAQGESEVLKIQTAAISEISPGRFSREMRVVFDETGQQRSRPESESSTIRQRFGLLSSTAAERSKCGTHGLSCSGLPPKTVVVDVGDPTITGDSATVVVRNLWSAVKADGSITTQGSSQTLRLLRLRDGNWVVVGGKVQVSG